MRSQTCVLLVEVLALGISTSFWVWEPQGALVIKVHFPNLHESLELLESQLLFPAARVKLACFCEHQPFPSIVSFCRVEVLRDQGLLSPKQWRLTVDPGPTHTTQACMTCI